MQSIRPLVGKLSSNIIISLISSVRSKRCLISFSLFENLSVAVLLTAYDVEHLLAMKDLTLSKPSFCSSLMSMVLVILVSKSCCPPVFYPSIVCVSSSLSSLILFMVVIFPPSIYEILPVCSETTTTYASAISERPIAALCLMP